MARKLLALPVVAAALGAVGPAVAGRPAIVRSLSVAHRHLVLGLSVGDLRPIELTVAKRRAVDMEGALLRKNVRFEEPIQLPPAASGIVRWQSPKALGPGIYFVQVKAVEAGGGITDCPRVLPDCLDRWSSVHRVVIRKSS